jgi:hypothetical protein
MPEISKDEMEKLLAKYKTQLEVNLTPENEETQSVGVIRTREYKEFKQEYLPKHMSWYEKACNQAEKLFKIAPDKKKAAALQESIDVCHLNITPTGAYSFSLLFPIVYIFLGVLISFVLTEGGLFFPVFFLITGAILLGPLGSAPHFMANGWRMKASNQMVLSIFYVVTYMRHTSNLELAIDFAAEHLSPPLSLDFKRIIWNIETQKYASVKESLDAYLETWRKWNAEFIESMHLIEGSLLEGDETARVAMLDKGLDVILQETYEKMLHYAHNLKSPITMLHMLGIILPILGLVILPMVVSFMEGVAWYHIATLYNIILPASVYYLGKQILSKRPTGYGNIDISKNPELKKFRNFRIKMGPSEIVINPIYLSIFIAVTFLLIAYIPLILHVLNPGWDVITTHGGDVVTIYDYTQEDAKFYFIGYKESTALGREGEMIGPFGLGAALLSIFMPLSIGLAVGVYYRVRTKNVLKIRNETKKLEDEFASALFQLGNRLGDGFPAEIAFAKVATAIPDTYSGKFFSLVTINITKLGMSVEQAIFDPQRGAILQYPSDLIETSMKVLVESAKKGPHVAAQALINVSRYIKEMHNVEERLKDLMADTISSMKSQVKFLTPVISGIVIGITSMVTTILGKLGGQLQMLQTESAAAQAGGTVGLTQLFGDGMPTFHFQIIVGFYVVQIVYILTVLVNGIENGFDKLSEDYEVGTNLTRSTIMYCFISLAVMILFNMIAGNIMGAGIS